MNWKIKFIILMILGSYSITAFFVEPGPHTIPRLLNVCWFVFAWDVWKEEMY